MAKKIERKMSLVGTSQKEVEKKVTEKFENTERKLHHKKSEVSRSHKQICCTVPPDDKELLEDLTLYLSNKNKKILNVSIIVRALIHLGQKYKDEIKI